MDKTVPAGAAIILDFIRDTEVGTTERAGYDVIFGHNQKKLPKPVTKMTLGEIQAAQGAWSKQFGSSATAGYQFMKKTLAGLIQELNLPLSMILDPDLQDRLGYHLLKRRGYEAFMEGRMSRTEFGKRLAQEWASFPVLENCQGAHRALTRGQSYYAGDGLNKSLVKPETVERILDAAKKAGNTFVTSKPADGDKPAVVVVETQPDKPTVVVATNPTESKPNIKVTTPPPEKRRTGLYVIFSFIAAAIAWAAKYFGG